MKILIKFTPSQLKQLEPLFVEIRKGGGADAILGQVFESGMAARVVKNREVLKIQKVLIGKECPGRFVTSPHQQMHAT